MPFLRFLFLSLASCFVWVFILSGAGYFFSGAVIGLIGDFQRLGKVLLVIVVIGIVGFYLVERFSLSKEWRRQTRSSCTSWNTWRRKSCANKAGFSGAHSFYAGAPRRTKETDRIEAR